MTPITITCALLGTVLGARILLRRIFSALDNVPGPPRKSLLTGNLTQFHDPDGWEFQRELEQSYGQVVKIHGLLGERHLFVFDSAALHSILVKDEAMYEDMPKFMCMNRLLFGQGIFSAIGDEHRKYRKILSPAFSTPHLREMIPLFYDVAERVRDGLVAPHVRDSLQMVDFNSIFGRTSLELIGRAGIGYSFDPMLPGQENTDRYAASLKALMTTVFKLALMIPLLPLVVKLIPFPSFLQFMIHFIPLPALHGTRDIVDHMDTSAARLVRDRKAALASGSLDSTLGAKDVMSLLMKRNVSADGAMYLTDKELVASTSMIIFAGTDTTSAALNRILYILAVYPDVQEKLRAEVLATPEYLSHDALTELPYLDAVLHEVLRLYPPVSPALFRDAVNDTVLPLSSPIIGVDGTVMHSIIVPKGTSIYIATAAANCNKRVWGEDALEFKPERWLNGKVDSVGPKTCGVYGGTMTFLGGARSCIGFKFAQLEIKVVVCVLLRAFKFSNPDPRIKWRKEGVIPSPNIDNRPELPILVQRL
ncbi:cytochrome P450 [Mycena capillaripes]|nr:cytochrome P450 [Mycena capillaripes]